MTGMRNVQIKPPSRLSQQLQKDECEKQSVKHYNINNQQNAYLYLAKSVHEVVHLLVRNLEMRQSAFKCNVKSEHCSY